MPQPLGQPGNSGRPAILLLYFVRDKYLETTERQLYESLRKNAALLEARDAQTALQYLSSSPQPQSVLIADASITGAAHAALLDALVEYARGGGRVIVSQHTFPTSKSPLSSASSACSGTPANYATRHLSSIPAVFLNPFPKTV